MQEYLVFALFVALGVTDNIPASYYSALNTTPAAFTTLSSLVLTITPYDSSYLKDKQNFDPTWNYIDPLLIIYCNSTTDVSVALNFTALHQNQVCVRSGGHSNTGASLCTGVVIDVSLMKSITFDSTSHTITMGAGVNFGDLVKFLHTAKRLVPIGGCPTVSVTGFTLGGGYGQLARRNGMGCDSLVEATMVTAQGTTVRATALLEPDLLWALKGAGNGNFGIVTEIAMKTYDWPEDTVGYQILWSLKDQGMEVLLAWQKLCCGNTSEGLQLTISPPLDDAPIPGPLIVLQALTFVNDTNGSVIADFLKIGTPSVTRKYFEPGNLDFDYLGYGQNIPQEAREFKRSGYVDVPIDQNGWAAIVQFFLQRPSEYNNLYLEAYGGNINRYAFDSNAFCHRSELYNLVIESFWITETEKKEANDWISDFYELLLPSLSSQAYQNYPFFDISNYTSAYFGDNYSKLRKIKSKWDPSPSSKFPNGFFNPPQGVRPYNA